MYSLLFLSIIASSQCVLGSFLHLFACCFAMNCTLGIFLVVYHLLGLVRASAWAFCILPIDRPCLCVFWVCFPA